MHWNLLLDSDAHPGSVNMALDQALLEDAARSGRAYLRLYRWDPPCLSFGRNEPALTRYDRAEIERRGLDVVRRPTGGRAVWHEDEVTYAVAAPCASFGTLAETYRAIHERLAAALRSLGISAALAPAGRPRDLAAGPCFAAPVGGEIVAHGRKVVGSAQVREGGAFLQHGSILLGGSQDVVRAVARGPAAPAAPPAEGGLRTLAGRPLGFADVAHAIVAAWIPAPEPGAPPAVDRSRFSDPRWTWRR